MWGSASGKTLLTNKLLTRWMKDQATSVEMTSSLIVTNMVCNERFVFVSHYCPVQTVHRVVSVHAIASGNLVAQLRPELEPELGKVFLSYVAINKDLVASLSTFEDGKKMSISIWSVPGPEVEVVTHASFTLPGHAEEDGEGGESSEDEDDGLGEFCRWTYLGGFHVFSDTKVVAQVWCRTHARHTLVVANKTVKWVCRPLLAKCMAYDCEESTEDGYIAAVGTASHINNDADPNNWNWNNDNPVEIDLPDLDNGIRRLVLRRPYLVLFFKSEARPRINVYKTGATEGTLLKSIAFRARFKFWPHLFSFSAHLLAFGGRPGLHAHIVRMDSLLDESNETAEEVEINLPGADKKFSMWCMNTTNLIFTRGDGVVIRKEFWVGPDHSWLPWR